MSEINQPIRWSLNKAAEEFGCARQTVKNRMVTAGTAAGEDGCYSTQEIVRAIFGDYQSEKTRLAKEQADKFALDNAERRRELIRVDDAVEIAQRYCHNIRQIFLRSSLTDEEKNAVLKEIQRLEGADFAAEVEDDEEDAGQ